MEPRPAVFLLTCRPLFDGKGGCPIRGLGLYQKRSSAPERVYVQDAKGPALLRTLTLRLKSIISRNGVKVQACRFES
jgi:hypothetical protein